MHISYVQFERSSSFGDYVNLQLDLSEDYYNLLEKYELPNNSIEGMFKYESDINKLLIVICFDRFSNKQKEELIYLLQKTMFKEF